MNIYDKIEEARAETIKRLSWLDSATQILAKNNINIPEEVNCAIYNCRCIDFDYCNRAQFNLIRKQFPKGTKWRREPNGFAMDYTSTIDGVTFRFWSAELPPSCTVVEETVVVPEHTEVQRKIVCKGEAND